MDPANVLIIGGGVIGCAIAEALSRRWQDVFLVEQCPKMGMATSSRNSGVIHSGIYYPTSSLKARLCVEGNRMTEAFCEKHNVAHRTTGKIIVATNAQRRAGAAGVEEKGRRERRRRPAAARCAWHSRSGTSCARVCCTRCPFHGNRLCRRTDSCLSHVSQRARARTS